VKGNPHPNWKSYREYQRLVALLDLALGPDWELVSIGYGEDLCEMRPEPTGRTGGVVFRLRGTELNGPDWVYGSIDFWDARAA
jgi:hypothetical protein